MLQNVEQIDLKSNPSKTYKIVTGCGNVYITLDYKDGKIDRIRFQRNSKLKCPITMLDALGRQTTYEIRRDVEQAIEDLRGGEDHRCDTYSIVVKSALKQGKLAAYSCQDAVAKVLERELKGAS